MEPLLFQIGFVVLLAFGGAAVAHRFGQSMMLAYIIVGILIGPFGPLPWKLVSEADLDGGFISVIGQMGLVLLMFFVGLEFYPSKIKEIGPQATVLAAADIGVTMLVGLSVCAWYGMTLIDSVFISSIVAMSSVAVTMKVLGELGWQGSKAAQALIGMMVIEDFAFIILITAGNGLFVGPAVGDVDFVWTFASIAVFLSFFMVLIFVFVPNVLTHIEKVKHEEAFILLALSTIFLSGAMAEALGLSAFVGAFFMGVAFAETNLAQRLKEKTVSFRDAFAAIFFVTFGMMIDPRGILDALPLLAVIVPSIIAAEVGVIAVTAYLVGNSPEDSMTIAGGTTARSEEAVIFASMGGNLKDTAGRYVLSERAQPIILPFTGAFCLAMSSTTPFLLRNSRRFGMRIRGGVPDWLKGAAAALQRSVSALMAADPSGKEFAWAMRGWFGATMLSIALVPTMDTAGIDGWTSPVWIAVAAVSAAMTVALWLAMRRRLGRAGIEPRGVSFASAALAALLGTVQSIVLLWPVAYYVALAGALFGMLLLLAGCRAYGGGARVSVQPS